MDFVLWTGLSAERGVESLITLIEHDGLNLRSVMDFNSNRQAKARIFIRFIRREMLAFRSEEVKFKADVVEKSL